MSASLVWDQDGKFCYSAIYESRTFTIKDGSRQVQHFKWLAACFASALAVSFTFRLMCEHLRLENENVSLTMHTPTKPSCAWRLGLCTLATTHIQFHLKYAIDIDSSATKLRSFFECRTFCCEKWDFPLNRLWRRSYHFFLFVPTNHPNAIEFPLTLSLFPLMYPPSPWLLVA